MSIARLEDRLRLMIFMDSFPRVADTLLPVRHLCYDLLVKTVDKLRLILTVNSSAKGCKTHSKQIIYFKI